MTTTPFQALQTTSLLRYNLQIQIRQLQSTTAYQHTIHFLTMMNMVGVTGAVSHTTL